MQVYCEVGNQIAQSNSATASDLNQPLKVILSTGQLPNGNVFNDKIAS